jgi:hypothetical protein
VRDSGWKFFFLLAIHHHRGGQTEFRGFIIISDFPDFLLSPLAEFFGINTQALSRTVVSNLLNFQVQTRNTWKSFS